MLFSEIQMLNFQDICVKLCDDILTHEVNYHIKPYNKFSIHQRILNDRNGDIIYKSQHHDIELTDILKRKKSESSLLYTSLKVPLITLKDPLAWLKVATT